MYLPDEAVLTGGFDYKIGEAALAGANTLTLAQVNGGYIITSAAAALKMPSFAVLSERLYKVGMSMKFIVVAIGGTATLTQNDDVLSLVGGDVAVLASTVAEVLIVRTSATQCTSYRL